MTDPDIPRLFNLTQFELPTHCNGSDGLQESRPPKYSDEALARRFADLYEKDFRYVALWNKWLYYENGVWRDETTLLAYDKARAVCSQAAEECNGAENLQRSIASAKTINAVVSLARSDRRLAAAIEQWDADPWLLNTPGGVIDLRTGNLRPHSRRDYITKITAVRPGGNCPKWREFLDMVTAGDKELQQFLQRFVGYGLTGVTREHALAFCYGHGGNGKGVFVNTVSAILGSYHQVAAAHTFTALKHEPHPTTLAALVGARLVTASETEKGRGWNETRLKQLTGGDKVRANFMRQDEFEYQPQFKLIISGNHKPSLRAVNEAMRRRFNVIPFTVTIPAEKRDPELTEKLKTEWPGILQWILEGCLEWQRIGLTPPATVVEATSAYLDAEDGVANWIDECCERDPNARTSSTVLFESWKIWAERCGEKIGNTKEFREALEQRGMVHYKTNKANVYQGLRVRKTE